MPLRVTASQAAKLLHDSERKNKYGVRIGDQAKAERVYNGVTYDSLAEAKYAASLDLRIRVGDIKAWYRQVSFPLVVNEILIGKLTIDFKILHRDGSIEMVEVKGFSTRDYQIRVKLFRALYPRTKLSVIKSKDVR